MKSWGLGRWRRVDPAIQFTFTDVPAAKAAREVLSESLVELGLEIVGEVRGPMRLWDFSRRLGRRLGMPPVPLADLSDAVKATLATIDDPRLRILAPGMQGAGYVYDAHNPESWPIRASR